MAPDQKIDATLHLELVDPSPAARADWQAIGDGEAYPDHCLTMEICRTAARKLDILGHIWIAPANMPGGKKLVIWGVKSHYRGVLMGGLIALLKQLARQNGCTALHFGTVRFGMIKAVAQALIEEDLIMEVAV